MKTLTALVIANLVLPLSLTVIFGLPLLSSKPIEKPVYLTSSAKSLGPIKADRWYLVAQSDQVRIAMPTQSEKDCKTFEPRLVGTVCMEGMQILTAVSQIHRGEL